MIVASSGRPTLATTLDSIRTQMRPGDELLLDVNDDAPWGHRARNRMMLRAKGDYLLFLDDDDFYLAGAFDAIRSAITFHRPELGDPERVHMFKMRYADGRELWRNPILECGNVSTQMFAVPRGGWYGARWSERYEGDWDFISCVCCQVGEPIWHRTVIAHKG